MFSNSHKNVSNRSFVRESVLTKNVVTKNNAKLTLKVFNYQKNYTKKEKRKKERVEFQSNSFYCIKARSNFFFKF